MEENLVKENSQLNDQEYKERKIILKSYPKVMFVQLDAPCNQDCLFCSRPDAYSYFDLEEYKKNYHEKLDAAMQRVERVNLTGSGELLLLPEAKKNLAYFNQYKYSEKMFATNGSSLTPKMIDYIIESGNRYTLHVSVHSIENKMHKVMTKSPHYDVVRHNLKYLAEKKRFTDKITVNLVFLLTTQNIEQFPDFISYAADLNVNGVVAYYNFIYRLDQKELSCYFIKERTNEVMDIAKGIASLKNIRLSLPPKFNQEKYDCERICGEAWSQLMINPRGDIITCDAAGDSRETISDKEFLDVWNGPYYTKIRTKLAKEGNTACSKYCFRATPSAVNDFKAHIITRGKSKEDVDKFMEGA